MKNSIVTVAAIFKIWNDLPHSEVTPFIISNFKNHMDNDEVSKT